MGDLWQDATFGPLGAVIALVLLAYYMAGEPLLGRWAADRLRRRRSADPGALLSFYQLTVACLAAAVIVLQTESLLPAMLLQVAIDLRSLLLTRAPA